MHVDDLSPEANAFLTAALAEFLSKQQWLRGRWPLEMAERWSFDQARGSLEFIFDDGSVMEVPGVPVGSFSEQDGRWEWAWHNPEMGSGAEVLEMGRALDIHYLKNGRFPLPDRALIPYLSAIALKAVGGDAVYIGDTGEATVVFVLRELRDEDEALPEVAVEPSAPAAVARGIPAVTPAPAAPARTFPFPFEAGRWEGQGTLNVVVVPEPIEIEASLRVVHGESWEIEQRLGDYLNRFVLAPLPADQDHAGFGFENADFGVGTGSFTVVGDTLLTFADTEGGMRFVESLRCTGPDGCEARGAFYLEGDRFATWTVSYRRAGT